MAKSDLTAQRLREVLHYDADTGAFTSLVQRGPLLVGSSVGCLDTAGYLKHNIDKRSYSLHRLAWLYVHGSFPKMNIDHLNGVKHDNRIINLRDEPQRTNLENQRAARSNSKTGILGVQYHAASCKWIAAIRHRGKGYTIGRFASAEEAASAYLSAKRRLHAGCTI